jgi:hypothetical protein
VKAGDPGSVCSTTPLRVAAIQRMTGLHPALHVLDGTPGTAFVPLAIEVLGHEAELDNQVGRQVLGSDLAHDDAGVGAADEVAAVNLGDGDCHFRVHV